MTRRQWIVGILGSIIVGTLGAGLWEVIVKPSLAWVAGVALTISTLGLDSLRDQIYADVAMGNYERASLDILALLTGFVGVVVIAIIFVLRVEQVRDISNRNKDRNIINAIGILYLVMLGTIMAFDLSRIVYTVNAQANIEQLYKSVCPYVTDEEAKLLISHMATISSRNDYIKIMDEMTDIGRSNNIKTKKHFVF